MAWTEVFICNRLSTKRVPGVDERCQKDAVPPQRSIFCGSKMLSMTVHPQKIPYLWTKGIYKNNSSTKDTLFVDKSGPKYLHKPKKPCISARLFLWCHQEMRPISKWLYIFSLKNRNKRNLPLLLHLSSESLLCVFYYL